MRATSPAFGSSSLITSAPRNASIWAQAGPAWLCVMSMMRMPERAWVMRCLRSCCRSRRAFRIPVLGEDLVDRIGAFGRQGLERRRLAVLLQIDGRPACGLIR